MQLALVGVGGAGGRIVDRIRRHERETGRTISDGNVLVFDTAAAEGELRTVPDDQCIPLGETHPRVGEGGVDGDVDLAASVTQEERYDVRRVFDLFRIHELDGVLLVAGLGGGTGGGAGSVLVEELRSMYDEPVYVLGVLPADEEGDGPVLNAARALRSVVPRADNTVLFDNDAWRAGADDDRDPYERANRTLATRVTSLLGAGELDGAPTGETAVDPSDIARTLDTGGVSSIGQASVDLGPDGLLSRLRGLVGSDDGDAPDPNGVTDVVRRALRSDLTLPCDVASAERALVVLSGPPSELSRRGFESARHLLEREVDTVEVLAGDEPDARASELTATVLLSNVTDVPRIDAIQRRAVAVGERDA